MKRPSLRSTDYEDIASRYDEERMEWDVSRDDVLDTFEPADAITVLDLGCGTGNYLAAQVEYFRDHAVRWLGVDPSPQMLAIAASKVGSARFVLASAEFLPFDDETVDYIFSGWSFHHFSDKSAAIREITCVLKPGARVRIRNIEPWNSRGWWVYEYFPEAWAADQARFWPVDKLTAALEQLRLSVVSADIEPIPAVPAAEALLLAKRRVISQLAVIDDAAYREGVERLEALAGDDPHAPAGDVTASVQLTASKR